MAFLFQTTTSAQNIMDATAQDVRQTLSSIALPDSNILLDYVDRVSKEMLRASKFIFLMPPPVQFVTQLGITDYWIGPNQTGPVTAYDTTLNLTDVRIVKPKSVIDRSNFRVLGHMDESPLAARLAYPDNTSRPGRPSNWRQDEANPNVLSIYPAPDNQNIFAPTPESPICTRVISGALLDRFYFIATTYIDSFGNESTPSVPTKIFIPANSLVVVNPPVDPTPSSTSGVDYSRFNVYAGHAASGTTLDVTDLTLQTPIPLVVASGTWKEPLTGLTTTGVTPPSDNMLEPIEGYVIEFRYFQLRIPVTDATQILQIPDDYRDVVTAGVNALTFAYLTRPGEAQKWYALYKDGISQIVRDINFMARGGGYIAPDPSTIGSFLPTVESIDLGALSN